MYDIHLILRNTPGELAWMGLVLKQHGISLEGGGVFSVGDDCHAHFLVEDGDKARQVLEKEGFNVQTVRQPLIRRLQQDRPGELGAIAAALSGAGINILTQYSDHANQLILITDAQAAADRVTRQWAVPPG